MYLAIITYVEARLAEPKKISTFVIQDTNKCNRLKDKYVQYNYQFN